MSDNNKHSLIFGPVPSRRLGWSLGIDIVPFKSCTQDCIYCQLGKAPHPTTTQRKSFINIDELIGQLKDKLSQGQTIDYITISGSGEPTLNIDLARVIDQIRQTTQIPVAIITNGTLLYLPDVRKDCSKADLVVPSLDAVNQQMFEKINRPNANITFDKLVDGLKQFRKEYKGKFWLEVFLIENINTDDQSLKQFKQLIEQINPDKVQLNTAVRPTAEKNVPAVTHDIMKHAVEILGPKTEITADFTKKHDTEQQTVISADAILEMLRRRPCSLEDIASGLQLNKNEIAKIIAVLLEQEKIIKEEILNTIYYKVN